MCRMYMLPFWFFCFGILFGSRERGRETNEAGIETVMVGPHRFCERVCSVSFSLGVRGRVRVCTCLYWKRNQGMFFLV